MLREVVGTFIDGLGEREFDMPLLALLSSQGFTDIHFIHGAFEFGKDVIAKFKDPETGQLQQYAIQSKAGDIGIGSWREVRPQLEESEYNTRAHPNFDPSLPRVAVLITTGRLKGAAPVDAQEFGEKVQSRGLARFELWDRSTISEWMTSDPSIGIVGVPSETELFTLISKIRANSVSEPMLEKYARRWISEGHAFNPRFAIEAALIVHSLNKISRLDLSVYATLHFLRSAMSDYGTPVPLSPEENLFVASARRLFESLTLTLLDQSEPHLKSPNELVRVSADAAALVTYPVLCLRLAELFALLSLVTADSSVQDRASAAVLELATRHPGTARPISDLFAVSIIPVVVVLNKIGADVAVGYLRACAQWALDAYDPDKSGLGLGGLDESDQIVVERILAGPMSRTTIGARQSSYLLTVILDLCFYLNSEYLFDRILSNVNALRLVPELTMANETNARWARGGKDVYFQPRVDYPSWAEPPIHHRRHARLRDADTFLLTASCRSRHYPSVLEARRSP